MTIDPTDTTTGLVRTVLGDVAPEALGAVDSHDHLFLTTPALPDEELDDRDAAEAVLRDFAAGGGGTLVQWTPRGLSRGLDELVRLSGSSGVHVVAATGRHRRAVYSEQATEPGLAVDELASVFVADVTERSCGLVKVGVGYGGATPDEQDALRAAAIAHHATGVPIAVHLEQGSAADVVLRLLLAEGVAVTSIVLGHLGRNPDLARIVEAAASGAWLCLDTPSPREPHGLGRLGDVLETLLEHGHLGQLLLGADTTVSSARSDPLTYGAPALVGAVASALADRLGAPALSSIMTGNPARAWALSR